MKSLLLLTFLFCVFQLTAHAQKINIDSNYLKTFREQQNHKKGDLYIALATLSTKLANPYEYDSTGILFPGVHRLPLDGMICLSPNTKQIAKIPNAYKGKVEAPYVDRAPRIPNVLPRPIPHN